MISRGCIQMDTIKPNKIKSKYVNKEKTNGKLNSAEHGKLWATYMGNSMSICILTYFVKQVEDPEIKKVVGNALQLSKEFLQGITEIYTKENYPIPIGFTEEDVNLGAPKLFSDEFYLHYLKYTGKAGLSLYTIAVPLMVRLDVREFFTNAIDSTIRLTNQVNDVLLAMGLLIKPPYIPIPEKIDFVKRQNYLNGFFGDIRPLHALEIAHIFDNIENNATSKALLVGFSQVVKLEKVRELFLRGREISEKQIEVLSHQLHRENLPSPPLLDDLVETSTFSPFSDKLMLFHKVDMFSMKLSMYGTSMSVNGRRDIGIMYARFLSEIGLYVEDMANLMIEHGWMEQPPGAVDRDTLGNES